MATVKKTIGRLPVYKGDWVAGTYSMLNQVTYLGSTFQSKIDNNTSQPATVVNNALQVNANWSVVSNGTAAYLAGERLTATESRMVQLEQEVKPNMANLAVSSFAVGRPEKYGININTESKTITLSYGGFIICGKKRVNHGKTSNTSLSISSDTFAVFFNTLSKSYSIVSSVDINSVSEDINSYLILLASSFGKNVIYSSEQCSIDGEANLVEASKVYLSTSPSDISIDTVNKTISITGGYFHSQGNGGLLPKNQWSYANAGSTILAVYLSDYSDLKFVRVGSSPENTDRFMFFINNGVVSGLQNYTLNGVVFKNFNYFTGGFFAPRYGILNGKSITINTTTRELSIGEGSFILLDGGRINISKHSIILPTAPCAILFDNKSNTLYAVPSANLSSSELGVIIVGSYTYGVLAGLNANDITTKKNSFDNYSSGHRDQILSVHYQPPAKVGFEFVNETTDFTSKLYQRFDKLVADNPSYASVRVLGKDETGTDIKCYEFKPAGVVLTDGISLDGELGGRMYKIMITSNHHGWEKSGTITNMWFFELLCLSDDPLFMWLRKNVHFITIPMVNPYGASTGDRKNKNGVDLNRNYSYEWWQGNPSDATYGGSAPFSEKGTQFVKSVIDANSDVNLFIDFHNFSRRDEGVFWCPATSNELLSVAKEVFLATYNSIEERYPQEFTTKPYPIGYADKRSSVGGQAQVYAAYSGRRTHACTFEINGGFRDGWDSATNPTRVECGTTMCLEGFINFIRCAIYRT